MPEKFIKYNPQIAYSKIGYNGQKKLSKSRALIIGCGAVGSAIANSLTRMGIGYIRLIDNDIIEIDNLQRQVLYTEEDAQKGVYKVSAAKKALNKINSDTRVEEIVDRVAKENISSYLEDIDIIFDGTDNLSTRYIINSAAVSKAVPYVYGAAAGESGAAMLILPEGPCLKCLLSGSQTYGETAQTAGILNQITMTIGAVESILGLRYILGDYGSLVGRYFNINIWDINVESLLIQKNPECPVCGKK